MHTRKKKKRCHKCDRFTVRRVCVCGFSDGGESIKLFQQFLFFFSISPQRSASLSEEHTERLLFSSAARRCIRWDNSFPCFFFFLVLYARAILVFFYHAGGKKNALVSAMPTMGKDKSANKEQLVYFIVRADLLPFSFFNAVSSSLFILLSGLRFLFFFNLLSC